MNIVVANVKHDGVLNVWYACIYVNNIEKIVPTLGAFYYAPGKL